jgi:hypothetical protein
MNVLKNNLAKDDIFVVSGYGPQKMRKRGVWDGSTWATT